MSLSNIANENSRIVLLFVCFFSSHKSLGGYVSSSNESLHQFVKLVELKSLRFGNREPDDQLGMKNGQVENLKIVGTVFIRESVDFERKNWKKKLRELTSESVVLVNQCQLFLGKSLPMSYKRRHLISTPPIYTYAKISVTL